MRYARRAAAGIHLPQAVHAGSVTLRRWRESDLEALVAACRDPEIIRFTRVPEHYDAATGRAYIRTRAQAALEGIAASLAIAATDDEERLLGSISLFAFSLRHRRSEVGYWIARPARGKGYATAALNGICRWAFDAAGLERIELRAATINPISQQVAERAGFQREAVLRRAWRDKAGEPMDMVCFGRLAEDPTASEGRSSPPRAR
ncbi:MAG TPA: GNAT family N-acetyltransferase [Solirubrobacteraceae bacterium]|nr:GNAT family N-acetyltransferase [Solirubrobacteraceae bacterium]